MKQTRLLILLITTLAFASCGSDEPRYADPEAHEKTVQLNEQYGPLMVGTWHYEKIGERQRYFERLTFKEDGTFTGYRKWQCRELVKNSCGIIYPAAYSAGCLPPLKPAPHTPLPVQPIPMWPRILHR